MEDPECPGGVVQTGKYSSYQWYGGRCYGVVELLHLSIIAHPESGKAQQQAIRKCQKLRWLILPGAGDSEEALRDGARQHCRTGMSLVELAVVVIIIGVIAAFGVPRLIKNVERSKAGEAFQYLAAIRSAQERHQARQGAYASDLSDRHRRPGASFG